MERAKGILYAALSSSTFGLAPLFTLLLLAGGYSPFEALSYRWGVAALFPGALAVCSGRSFRLGRRELVTVFLLSLFRAVTSLSLIIAYQHIASGVASTIYFMYPLAVALAMMCFFREKGSAWVFAAIGMSVVGAVLLSLGNVDFTVENSALGMVSACVSVFSYGGYIVGVRKSRAVEISRLLRIHCHDFRRVHNGAASQCDNEIAAFLLGKMSSFLDDLLDRIRSDLIIQHNLHTCEGKLFHRTVKCAARSGRFPI